MRFVRDENGAAAIEAALVLPFYFAFIFATIELGNIYWAYNSIQYVADEVARCNAVSACNGGTTAYKGAANLWSSASAAASEITVTPNTTCGNYTGTKVTIVHPISSLTGYFPKVMPSPFNQIAVQSCYPNPS
jgi:Flp pilus assembly protein TadG